MKFNLLLWFFFLGLLSASFGDIDFQECGLDDVEIERIDVETCLEAPCPVVRGHSYRIFVHQDQISPRIDDISVSARALIRGASFPVSAYAINPCVNGFTLGGECNMGPGDDPVLEIRVVLNPTLLRGPAPLIINATYLRHGVPKCRFCFEFDVDIF